MLILFQYINCQLSNRNIFFTDERKALNNNNCAPFQLVLEVELTRHGFRGASTISMKLLNCLRILQRSLSSDHLYAFNTTFLKDVVRSAATHLRKDSEIGEEDLIMWQLKSKVASRIHKKDRGVMGELFQLNIFQSHSVDIREDDQLRDGIKDFVERNNLSSNTEDLESLIRLYDCVNKSQVVVVTGDSGSGKITAISAIENVMKAAKKKLIVYHLNPTIFGTHHEIKTRMRELFVKLFLYARGSPKTDLWIVLKSVQKVSKWLNVIMADLSEEENTYYLSIPDKFATPKNVKILSITSNVITENQDANLCKVDVVYFESKVNICHHIIQTWVNSLYPGAKEYFQRVIENKLLSILTDLKKSGWSLSCMQIKAHVFTVLAKALLEFSGNSNGLEEQNYKDVAEIAFYYSFNSVFGEKIRPLIENSTTSSTSNFLNKCIPFSFKKEIRSIAEDNDVILTQTLMQHLFICSILLEHSIPHGDLWCCRKWKISLLANLGSIFP